MASEKEYIALFRTLVTEKLVLGASDGTLKQRDYEYLARLIEEKSKVRLSLSTLKRVWKNDHAQEPHPATLDALASSLGYSDWQSFKKANTERAVDHKPEDVTMPKRRLAWPVFAGVGVILVIAGFFMLQGFNKTEKKLLLPGKIPFKADKTVTSGVPNTVLFSYDLKNIKADSFFIQQSWNPKNKVKIDPAKNFLSSTYYTPGFHRAKLIVNDSIVSTARIHVKTNGWSPIVQYDIADNSPYYLDNKAVISEGVMHTPNKVFEAANVDLERKFFLRYYNIRDFEGINSDNFSIETRLKHDRMGNVACPFAELTILTEEHIFYIPITSKGCVGELELKIGETYKSGRDNDLSGLGTNVFEFQTLRVENRQKQALVFLNDSRVAEIKYQRDFGKIVGIIYTFNGPGSVDYIRLNDVDGKRVYQDEFD